MRVQQLPGADGLDVRGRAVRRRSAGVAALVVMGIGAVAWLSIRSTGASPSIGEGGGGRPDDMGVVTAPEHVLGPSAFTRDRPKSRGTRGVPGHSSDNRPSDEVMGAWVGRFAALRERRERREIGRGEFTRQLHALSAECHDFLWETPERLRSVLGFLLAADASTAGVIDLATATATPWRASDGVSDRSTLLMAIDLFRHAQHPRLRIAGGYVIAAQANCDVDVGRPLPLQPEEVSALLAGLDLANDPDASKLVISGLKHYVEGFVETRGALDLILIDTRLEAGVRIAALDTIARSPSNRDDSLRRSLLALAADESGRVRERAMALLADLSLGRSAADGEVDAEVARYLRDALYDPSEAVRAEAVRHLALGGSGTAYDTLQVVMAGERASGVRRAAMASVASALLAGRVDPDTAYPLIRDVLRDDSSTSVKLEAVSALVPMLLASVESAPSKLVRAAEVRALLLGQPQPVREAVVAWIEKQAGTLGPLAQDDDFKEFVRELAR